MPGHACSSVQKIGWSGVKNGQLLQQAAASGYEVLISMDASLASQQNLGELPLSVIVLRARTNRLEDTSPLMPQVLAILPTLKPGNVVTVGP